MTLKISISGVRGIVGESLTEEIVENFAKAFGTYMDGGRVVIGTDNRASKNILKKAAIKGLLSCSCEIIEIGICPTPTVQIAVKEFKADGGIIITASHNPAEWNGMKFIRHDGIFLNAEQAEKLIDLYNVGKRINGQTGKLKERRDAIDIHIKKVLANIDTEKIREKRFKVAVDSCQGAGKIITEKFLKELNCEIVPVEAPRGFEPVPENLTELCQAVKEYKADIGFAQDPDADRLSIVSEEGVAIGEEYSVALASDFILNLSSDLPAGKAGLRAQSSVVVNLSTSSMIDDIAKKYGAKVIRTKVGEVNVSEKMREVNAIIGGEGNGGVIYPKVGYGRDSLAGIGIILNYLCKSRKKISELVNLIPKYYMYKGKIEGSDLNLVIKKIKEFSAKGPPQAGKGGCASGAKEAEMNLEDGIKIINEKFWIHLRPSNTEPIVRIIIEAKNKDTLEELKSLILKV